MKALANPPSVVKNVALCIVSFKPIPGSNFADNWDGCRQMMDNPKKLL